MSDKITAIENRFWVDVAGELVPFSPEQLLAEFESGQIVGQTPIRFSPTAPAKPFRRYMRELVWMAYQNRKEDNTKTERSLFEVAFNRAPIGMILSDLAGRIQHVNAAFCEMLGYSAEELTGMRVGAISDESARDEELALGNQVISGKRVSFQIEKVFITKTQQRLQTLLSVSSVRDSEGSPSQVIGHVLDLSQRKALERDLAQSERIRSVGRLAGGVAHDFNNLLTVILGELPRLRDGEGLARKEAVSNVSDAAQASARLVQQLMAFSRDGVVEVDVVDINDELVAMRPVLEAALPACIDLDFRLSKNTLPIRINAIQLEQVVMNLVFNARSAMPDGGKLMVRTDGESGSVFLEIADTGVGMTPEVLARAYEPFFTTGSAQGKTGMGLAMVYGIVTRFDGNVFLDSKVGRGTRCHIEWPRQDTHSEQSVEPIAEIPPEKEASQRVLVVDDQPAILRMVSRILRMKGYEVIQASTFAEAKSAIKEAHEPLDLLLTDVRLPDGNGPDLGGYLRDRWSDAAILYISGYTADILTQGEVMTQRDGFVQKPFTAENLLSRVSALINN